MEVIDIENLLIPIMFIIVAIIIEILTNVYESKTCSDCGSIHFFSFFMCVGGFLSLLVPLFERLMKRFF